LCITCTDAFDFVQRAANESEPENPQSGIAQELPSSRKSCTQCFWDSRRERACPTKNFFKALRTIALDQGIFGTAPPLL
jgi:hypothetical protein